VWVEGGSYPIGLIRLWFSGVRVSFTIWFLSVYEQHKTIDSVLARGEKLDSLVEKSSDLSAASQVHLNNSFYTTLHLGLVQQCYIQSGIHFFFIWSMCLWSSLSMRAWWMYCVALWLISLIASKLLHMLFHWVILQSALTWIMCDR